MGQSAEPSARRQARRPRREARVALKPPLALGVQGDARPAVRAHLVNLSRSGAAILTDALLGDPGAALVLQLPAGPAGEPAPVPCEIRWVLAEQKALPPRWLHGALFGSVDLRALRLIEDLLHDARRATSRR